MSPRALPARRSGFTLLELITAMAILATLIAVLGRVLTGALGVWNRQVGQSSAGRSVRVALDLVARDLEGAVASNDVDTVFGASSRAPDSPGFSFTVREPEDDEFPLDSELDFVTLLSRSPSLDSDSQLALWDEPDFSLRPFARVRYWVTNETDSAIGTLMRSVSPVPAGFPGGSAPSVVTNDETVLRGVVAFHVTVPAVFRLPEAMEDMSTSDLGALIGTGDTYFYKDAVPDGSGHLGAYSSEEAGGLLPPIVDLRLLVVPENEIPKLDTGAGGELVLSNMVRSAVSFERRFYLPNAVFPCISATNSVSSSSDPSD